MSRLRPKVTEKYKPAAMGSQRFIVLIVGLLLLVIILIMRLSSLQVMEGVEHGYEYLQRQGENRMVRREVTPAQRGMILDRNGEPLAVSTHVYSLVADPKVVFAAFNLSEKTQWSVEQHKNWQALAAKLGQSEMGLEKYFLRYKNKRFLYLHRQMTPEAIQEILNIGIEGIFSQQENKRFYPAGEVTSHMVGITDIDDKGREGLELAYNTWLQGVDGIKQVIKDLRGRVIRDVRSLHDSQAGHELITSIDLRLQYLAYRELKAAVVRNKAKAGSVVVLDVKTGEILAIANQPAINPNDRGSFKQYSLRNRALADAFEPGSTMKPFTILAALESGLFTPGTILNTSPGWIRVGNKTLRDHQDLGYLSLAQVLQKSSQVGTTKVALSIKESQLWDVFHRAGFGQTTGSEFPGERTGALPNHRSWKNIDKATFAFGYGLNVTLLQLARAYSVFANNGALIEVSFIKREMPQHGKQLFKEKYVAQVLDMMRSVTQDGGTGKKADVPGYSVAGKTGTAHKLDGKDYAENKYTSSFVGLVPSRNPKVVVAVMIDEPSSGTYYGGDVAAPVFSSVATSAMRVLNVQPDEPQFFEKMVQR